MKYHDILQQLSPIIVLAFDDQVFFSYLNLSDNSVKQAAFFYTRAWLQFRMRGMLFEGSYLQVTWWVFG